MIHFLKSLVDHLILIEIVLVGTLIVLGILGWRTKALRRCKALVQLYHCAIVLATLIGIYIGGVALLAQYDLQWPRDPDAATWNKKVMFIRQMHGNTALISPDCSAPVIRSGDRESDILLEVSFSIYCDPRQAFVLDAVLNPDPFVRYSALKSWFRESPRSRASSDDRDTEMLRRIGTLLSTGQFPSEMSYGQEGDLSRRFREHLRDKGLVWLAIWTIPDKSVSAQIAFKELARIGTSSWFHMTEPPRQLDHGFSRYTF